MLYWLLKLVLLGPLLRLWCRPTVEGAEHIPETGGALLASNHLAVADSFLLPTMVERRIVFLAKREYFTQPGLVGWLKKQFFTGVGQVPIDRGSGNAARAALDTGIRLLREERLVGIYPEGTRSPDGRLYKGKTGIARLALQTGVKVIPVAMIGTDEMNPIGSKMWKPAKVTVRIGEPIDFSRFEGMGGNRFVERTVTDEVMYALMRLSGQQYVDIYAASLKNRPAEQDAAATAADADRLPDTQAG